MLTLFERLTAEQLPFYLELMRHLAAKGIPVPDPQADRHTGAILHSVCGKPAAVVQKLHGASQLLPDVAHCAAVGDMLARMHLAGQDFGLHQPNLRGLPWWNATVPQVLPFMAAEAAHLLQAELAHQNTIASSTAYAALPRGPVHADLFATTSCLRGPPSPVFSIFTLPEWIRGYSTCAWHCNDWCIHHTDGSHHADLAQAMLHAYQAVRPLTDAEQQLLPICCGPGHCGFGFPACGITTCHAKRPCSPPTIRAILSGCCARVAQPLRLK